MKNILRRAEAFIDARATKDNTSLSQFLRDLAAAVVDELSEQRKFLQGSDVKSGIVFLDSLINNFNAEANFDFCSACMAARRSDDICNGSPRDRRIITKSIEYGTGCLNYIIDLFLALVAEAGGLYGTILTEAHSAQLHLTLDVVQKDTGSLGASTFFPNHDEAGNRHAEITIQIPLDFNEFHLTQLPYVFFHEIFVHGPESWIAARCRSPTNERCPFREGFVDAAALHALEVRLKGGLQIPGSSSGLNLSNRYLEGSRDAHSHRTRAGPNGVPWDNDVLVELLRIRREGAVPFERMRDAGLGTEAVKLALILNPLPLTETQRGSIVEALETCTGALLEPGPERAGSTRWPGIYVKIIEILRQESLPLDAQANAIVEVLVSELDPSEFGT